MSDNLIEKILSKAKNTLKLRKKQNSKEHTDYSMVLDITDDDGVIFKVGVTQNDIKKMLEEAEHE